MNTLTPILKFPFLNMLNSLPFEIERAEYESLPDIRIPENVQMWCGLSIYNWHDLLFEGSVHTIHFFLSNYFSVIVSARRNVDWHY